MKELLSFVEEAGRYDELIFANLEEEGNVSTRYFNMYLSLVAEKLRRVAASELGIEFNTLKAVDYETMNFCSNFYSLDEEYVSPVAYLTGGYSYLVDCYATDYVAMVCGADGGMYDDEVGKDGLYEILEMARDSVLGYWESLGPCVIDSDEPWMKKKIVNMTEEEKMACARHFASRYDDIRDAVLSDHELWDEHPEWKELYEGETVFSEISFISDLEEFGEKNKDNPLGTPAVFLSVVMHAAEDAELVGAYIYDLNWNVSREGGEIIEIYNSNPQNYSQLKEYVKVLMSGGNNYAYSYVADGCLVNLIQEGFYNGEAQGIMQCGVYDCLDASVSYKFMAAIAVAPKILELLKEGCDEKQGEEDNKNP